MILSRSKPAFGALDSVNKNSTSSFGSHKPLPKFNEFLKKRDYTGALTLLDFKQGADNNPDVQLWMGYSAFHLGDYKRALGIYENLLFKHPDLNNVKVNLACCYFYLGMYTESKEKLKTAPPSSLKTRLNFHLSHKLGDEGTLMEHHEQLQDVLEDQLSLAALHYLRAHYQEAIDIYKRILLQNRENLALNVYVALCYYKLDYYDVSQEVLGVYLNQYPDSVIATNLKACNNFRLYNGAAAESELRTLVDQSNVGCFGHDLVRHNLVVFRNGEGSLQVLPPLVDIVSEAKLNLVIYYLRQDETHEAYQLLKDMQPAVPQEYILKGVVNAALGQEMNLQEYIKTAEDCFHLVGNSASECDTIPGRQCMAAAYFMSGNFEEVLVYLSSIKSYFHSDDTFNFNYAQAKIACEQFKEAEETFLLVQDPKIRHDYVYISNLARCYVMNKKPQLAWELYLKMEVSTDAFSLLLLLANDCYRMGEFWHAAKAFDMLDRLEPNPEFWEGKRGAVVGVFQGVIAQTLPVELLGEVLQLLRNSANSQADQIAKVIRKWAKEKRVNIMQ